MKKHYHLDGDPNIIELGVGATLNSSCGGCEIPQKGYKRRHIELSELEGLLVGFPFLTDGMITAEAAKKYKIIFENNFKANIPLTDYPVKRIHIVKKMVRKSFAAAKQAVGALPRPTTHKDREKWLDTVEKARTAQELNIEYVPLTDDEKVQLFN